MRGDQDRKWRVDDHGGLKALGEGAVVIHVEVRLSAAEG